MRAQRVQPVFQYLIVIVKAWQKYIESAADAGRYIGPDANFTS